MLPVTTAQEAYPIAERILAGVGATRVETAKGQAVVTLSIGIAETLFAPPGERLGGDDSVERVVHRADDAMYAAKAAGRNRISVYSEPSERPEGGEEEIRRTGLGPLPFRGRTSMKRCSMWSRGRSWQRRSIRRPRCAWLAVGRKSR